MKQLFLLLLMLAVPKCILAQTAKALWCSDQTTLVFVYDDNTYTAGSTVTVSSEVYSKTYTVSEAYELNLTTPPFYPPYVHYIDPNHPGNYTDEQEYATTVVFDDSFKFASPT